MGEKIIQAALPEQDGGVAVSSLSRARLFVTSWTVALKRPLSMGFPRRNIREWVAISFSRGNLPDPGIEPASPALAGSFSFFFKPLSHQGSPIQQDNKCKYAQEIGQRTELTSLPQ